MNQRPATWTTNSASKTYGDPDPSPLTTGSGSGFLPADGVTATYSRATGETVLGGPYAITATLGPVAVLSNYLITNAGANFTINRAARDVDDEPREQDVWGSGPESADDGERQRLSGGRRRDGDLWPGGG